MIFTAELVTTPTRKRHKTFSKSFTIKVPLEKSLQSNTMTKKQNSFLPIVILPEIVPNVEMKVLTVINVKSADPH